MGVPRAPALGMGLLGPQGHMGCRASHVPASSPLGFTTGATVSLPLCSSYQEKKPKERPPTHTEGASCCLQCPWPLAQVEEGERQSIPPAKP